MAVFGIVMLLKPLPLCPVILKATTVVDADWLGVIVMLEICVVVTFPPSPMPYVWLLVVTVAFTDIVGVGVGAGCSFCFVFCM